MGNDLGPMHLRDGDMGGDCVGAGGYARIAGYLGSIASN